jgi:acyl carrier protein
MTKEEVRATTKEIVAQISPDKDPTNLNGDIPIREQVELNSTDFLDIITEVRTPYGVEVSEDDYMQSVTLGGSIACLARRAKEF